MVSPCRYHDGRVLAVTLSSRDPTLFAAVLPQSTLFSALLSHQARRVR